MKYIKIITILIVALLCNFTSVQAHALVIETASKGEVGVEQEVKIYYSEFKDGTLEKVSDWYSNVADFKIWLIKPNAERVQLKTKAEDEHFRTVFTPENKGAYRLEISHMAEDPGDKTAYQFNAFAQVNVGEFTNLPVFSTSPDLVLLESNQVSEQSHNKSFRTYFKGEPKNGVSVAVFYPSGRIEELQTNEKGELEIDFSESGSYFLEATTFDEEEAGKTSKASYDSVWRVATQKISI